MFHDNEENLPADQPGDVQPTELPEQLPDDHQLNQRFETDTNRETTDVDEHNAAENLTETSHSDDKATTGSLTSGNGWETANDETGTGNDVESTRSAGPDTAKEEPLGAWVAREVAQEKVGEVHVYPENVETGKAPAGYYGGRPETYIAHDHNNPAVGGKPETSTEAPGLGDTYLKPAETSAIMNGGGAHNFVYNPDHYQPSDRANNTPKKPNGAGYGGRYMPAQKAVEGSTTAQYATSISENGVRKISVGGWIGAGIAALVVGILVYIAILAAQTAFIETQTTTNTPTAAQPGNTETGTPPGNTPKNETARPEAPEEHVANTDGSTPAQTINVQNVAEKVLPSIVTINLWTSTNGERIEYGSGSGVIWDNQGRIVTNEHVVNGAETITVELQDGRTYDAQRIGDDELTDLAVIQISGKNLTPIQQGELRAMIVGSPVVALGNPLGQAGGASVTDGILSAFDRTVEFGEGQTGYGLLQTDAAINSGSSGGALVNNQGQLVGITSAIGVSQAGPEGIGYAIPIDLVHRIATELIETGDVQHPFVGITVLDYTSETADGAQQPQGAQLATVEKGSAGQDAGLQAGDIVTRIGNRPIANTTDLILAVRLYRVGQTAEFEILRDNDTLTTNVIMEQRPGSRGG